MPGAQVLEVHHVIPFHICVLLGRPELELDPRNLLTLCAAGDNHHLLLGHLDSYASFNKSAAANATRSFHGKTAIAIHSDPVWLSEVRYRPIAWAAMPLVEREMWRRHVEERFS